MFKSRTGILLAFTLVVAGTAPALAQQSSQYATDPDPFVYNLLGFEHRALSHTDAVLPRTKLPKGKKVTAERGPGYATDPDPAVWGLLAREHLALNHPDAVMQRTRSTAAPATIYGNRTYTSTDPDIRIRAELWRENNVY